MTLVVVLAIIAAISLVVTAATIASDAGGSSGARADREREAAQAGARSGRRKVRFEETFDLTVPEGPAFGPPAETRAPVYLLDEEEEGIPLSTRILGAIRLALVIALSAAAVAGAIWAAGYFLTGQVSLTF
ncbi:MAG: hypothetical protein HY658_07380 [Actinobacteria bacterium]|nr:hypothetical protein [Actinomycetota bacterium]